MRTLWEAINDDDDKVMTKSNFSMLGVDVKKSIEGVYGPLEPDEGRHARKGLLGEVEEKYFQDFEHKEKTKMTYVHTDKSVNDLMKKAKAMGVEVVMDKSDHHYGTGVDTRKYYIVFRRKDAFIKISIEADMTHRYGVDTIRVYADDFYKQFLQ